ncbi:DUF1731 domain-containing protein [Mucilaginibacter sp. UYCu711]
MSSLVLNSTNALPQGLLQENYTFKYASLNKALKELYG